MSTGANAALAWPIEATEPALIGNQLAGRKKTPASVREVWGEPGGHGGELVVELCGTSIPGNVRLACLDGNRRPSVEDIPEAGMWWSEAAMAWRVRPFTGDWLSDPRVFEEGTETGYWAITAECGKLELWEQQLLGLDHEFAHNMALMHDLGSGPAFENHEAPMGGDGVYRAEVE